MENLTEMVFILDRSGSMAGLEKDTIGGFNSLLEKQKKEKGKALVTTMLFDDDFTLVHDRQPIHRVAPLTEEQYFVCGCTALLDAIGLTISHIKKARKEMPKEERPDRTIVVITTDGMENSSRHYNYAKIKHKIEKCKKKNWEFLFLGANMDAIGEAAKFGIDADRAVRYECDGEGTRKNYDVLGETITRARGAELPCMMAQAIGTGWSEEIEQDYKKDINRKMHLQISVKTAILNV